MARLTLEQIKRPAAVVYVPTRIGENGGGEVGIKKISLGVLGRTRGLVDSDGKVGDPVAFARALLLGCVVDPALDEEAVEALLEGDFDAVQELVTAIVTHSGLGEGAGRAAGFPARDEGPADSPAGG